MGQPRGPGPCERRSKGSTGKRERSPQREKHPHSPARGLIAALGGLWEFPFTGGMETDILLWLRTPGWARTWRLSPRLSHLIVQSSVRRWLETGTGPSCAWCCSSPMEEMILTQKSLGDRSYPGQCHQHALPCISAADFPPSPTSEHPREIQEMGEGGEIARKSL